MKMLRNRKVHPLFDSRLILFNMIILVCTIALIMGTERHFQKVFHETTLRENGFLTTEWRILKEMKEQTDKLLRDKDEEIQAIRRKYRELLAQNASADRLSEIENLLRKTETEREQLLSTRFTPSTPQSTKAPSVPTVLPDDRGLDSTPLTENPMITLLNNRVKELEREKNGLQEENDRFHAEIIALKARQEGLPVTASSPGSSETISESETLRLIQEQRAVLETSSQVMTVADIRTRTLLRAIVRDPAIQSDYPGLVENVDRYFEVFGAAERLKGKKEAYEEMIRGLSESKARD